MKIYYREDIKNWGPMFAAAYLPNNEIIRFQEAADVPDEPNIVYMMQHHNPVHRAEGKRVTQDLSRLKNIKMIPSHRENYLYDDKVQQYYLLGDYMPRTYLFTSAQEASLALLDLEIPFISKSAQGAASKNVDLIETRAQAEKQIEQAFSLDGIPRHYHRRQSGYLLWQEFLAHNFCGYKVILIANKYAMIFCKTPRVGSVFASGSPHTSQVVHLNYNIVAILRYCSQIASQYRLSFTGIDIIFDNHTSPGSREPRLLEITTDWSIDPCCIGCHVFRRNNEDWQDTGNIITTEQDMFNLVPNAFAEWDFTDNFVWPD